MSTLTRSYLRNKLLWIGADFAVADPNVRRALPAIEIQAERSFSAAVPLFRDPAVGLVVLSLDSLDCSAEQALEGTLRHAGHLPFLIHHRDGTIGDVIRHTRCGAFHTFIGDIDPPAFADAVADALRKTQPRAARDESAPWRHFLIGQSRPMLQVCEVIQLIASKRCTILISGETGTGKEVIAKAIHAAGNRSAQPLVAVNCTALPANLVETELFGHAKGAFTGAVNSRIGRFEQANRGSIFLDEIGDLPLDAQAKLLRVLQEHEFQRVGSSETVRVDVRVIAASNVDLEQAIRERRFREDLYYRLNVVPIHLPPLRERRDDIPHLLHFFLEKIRAAEHAQPKQISDEAIEYLQQRDWPGNIRQLEHAVHMAFALSGERNILTPQDFVTPRRSSAEQPARTPAPSLEMSTEGLDFEEAVSSFELSLLNQALTITQGNKARAAELLKIKRTTLLAKIKALDDRTSKTIPDFIHEACA